MEYVIAFFDEDKEKVYYGDAPTSKIQAQRWANGHAKEIGGVWFVVPAVVAAHYDNFDKGEVSA